MRLRRASTGYFRDVHPVQQHLAAGDVVEAGDQVDEAGLAHAGAAHDGDGLAGPGHKVDVVEHVVAAAPGLVLEVHMAELHLTGGSGQLTDGVLAVLDGGLLVNDLEDTLGTGAGADELEQHHGDHHNGD